MRPQSPAASKLEAQASLLPDLLLRPEEATPLEVPSTDGGSQQDGIAPFLEGELASYELIAAPFEVETAACCDACRTRAESGR